MSVRREREAGFRRIQTGTRWMVAGAVAAAGLLSLVAEKTIPGSSSHRTVSHPTKPLSGSGDPTSGGGASSGSMSGSSLSPPTSPPTTASAPVVSSGAS